MTNFGLVSYYLKTNTDKIVDVAICKLVILLQFQNVMSGLVMMSFIMLNVSSLN